MQESTDQSPAQKGIQVQKPSLQKGGGSVQGMGETFASNEFSGSASMTIPIPASPCRGFEPSMSLNYSSGNGNASFGMGWELSTPEITRRTSKEIPKYTDDDTYLYTADDYLIPIMDKKGKRKIGSETIAKITYEIHYYQPRSQSHFDKIERLRNPKDLEDTFWRVTNASNTVSIFGKSKTAKVFDPQNHTHIYKWLLEETYDDMGNHQIYTYEKENSDNIPSTPSEVNRDHQTQAYPAKVYYGNFEPITDGSIITGESSTVFKSDQWHFEIVFDYGTHQIDLSKNSNKAITTEGQWKCRKDPFSSYSTGFEIRTFRLCEKIMLFHRFDEVHKGDRFLTTALFLQYEQSPILTQLKKAFHTGFQFMDQAPYRTKSLPGLNFNYTPFAPSSPDYQPHQFELLEGENDKVVHQASDGPNYQFIDLYGEGIPGILYNGGQTITYRAPLKTNLIDTQYAAAKNIDFPIDKIGASHVLNDVTGNGRLDLMVNSPQRAGYYQFDVNDEWTSFEAFESFPSNYLYSDNSQLDVTGDGVADVLLIEQEKVRFNASLREKGFAPSLQRQRVDDLPSSKQNAPNEMLLFTDMIGSGLSQRVRITKSKVECWPNLGYGKFGKKVIMDNTPNFGADFVSSRLLWADIDGSGTTDLAYISTSHIDIYLNQSGNAFATKPIKIPFPAQWDRLDQIQFADIKGNGTNCLVFSQSHPTPKQWYYDFNQVTINGETVTQKPYLLNRIDNNMGATTSIRYASSTQYYLQDKANGTPWITHLPFPVNVIESVTHHDEISNTKTVSSYHYSHGYYDGFEREFRGFGRVDRRDSFTEYNAPKEEYPYLAPPAYTKTWYHTGAFMEEEDLIKQYTKEYWKGDPKAYQLPETHFDFSTNPLGDTLRDAHRTLHGSVLRTEVYGNDDSPWQNSPYTVSETQFRVEEIQEMFSNKYSAFLLHIREKISYDYERNAADPRISHEFILKQDAYGHVLESCSVAYPRRSENIPSGMGAQTKKEQLKKWVSYGYDTPFNSSEADTYWEVSPPADQTASGGYLIGESLESKGYEITGLTVGKKGYFTFSTIKEQIEKTFEGTQTNGKKHLLHWDRDYYYDPGSKKELPFKSVKAPVLSHRTEFVEFDKEKLSSEFNFLSTQTLSYLMTNEGEGPYDVKGGYISFGPKSKGEDKYYWNPGSSQSYNDSTFFYLPAAYFDPFQYLYINWNADATEREKAVKTTYHYDHYHLFANKIIAPLGNQTEIEYDYRTLHPAKITDINQNISSVIVDPLGMVITSSTIGSQEGKTVSFLDLKNYVLPTNPIAPNHPLSIKDIIANPQDYLQRAASFFYYDLHSWINHKIPTHAVSLVYDDYTFVDRKPVSTIPQIQKSISYSDGFGRPVQSKAYYDGNEETPWLTTGVVRYDDKGQPIKKFEPYFAVNYEYKLHEAGYSNTLFYDALGRMVLERTSQQKKVEVSGKTEHIPDGFFTKTLFGSLDTSSTGNPVIDYNGYLNNKLYAKLNFPFTPSPWSALMYDENDCIDDSHYKPEANKPNINIDQDAIDKAKKFANTPFIHIENGLGNVVQSQQLNVLHENEKNVNYFTFDILGDELTSTDQRLHPQHLNNFKHIHSLTKESIKVISADAGTKWSLTDVVGHPIFSNDSRGTWQFHTYDELLRPMDTYVKNDKLKIDQIVQKVVYGDSQQSNGTPYFEKPHKLNLRGKPVIGFDQAGLTLAPSFDINGHGLLSAHWLKKGYKEEANWTEATSLLTKDIATAMIGKYTRSDYSEFSPPTTIQELLESEVYETNSNFDAIGRVQNSVDADGNISFPQYYSTNWIAGSDFLGGLLVDNASFGAPSPGFFGVQYNPKGQRTEISYSNGTKTKYEYDPFTFELTEIKTTRQIEEVIETVQHLQYHHDPVGNVTSVPNMNAPTKWYNNQAVVPKAEYTYDALYKLIKATGREHIGMWKNDQSNQNKFNSSFFSKDLPQLTDGNALRNYTQTYQYDNGGNLIQLKHNGKNSSTRNTVIQAGSNGIKTSGFGTSKSPTKYKYDVNGNMLTLDGCQGASWNYRDNMQSATVIKGSNTEYYVYNGAGTRVRKVHELIEGNSTTIKEVIYLGGIEVRKRYTLFNGSTTQKQEREWHTVRLEDGSNSFCTWRYLKGAPKKHEIQLQLRYQLNDSLNSSTLELDENASIITYEEYFPYGGTSIMAATNQTEIKTKHYHYSAKEKDGITGLYYYGMRYYAPWLGRWTCTDPAGTIDGLNIYAMVEGNPVTHVDIGGMDENNGKRGKRVRDEDEAVFTCEKPLIKKDNRKTGFEANALRLSNNQKTTAGQLRRSTSTKPNYDTKFVEANDKQADYLIHKDEKGMDETFSTNIALILKKKFTKSSDIIALRREVRDSQIPTHMVGYRSNNKPNEFLQHPTSFKKAIWQEPHNDSHGNSQVSTGAHNDLAEKREEYMLTYLKGNGDTSMEQLKYQALHFTVTRMFACPEASDQMPSNKRTQQELEETTDYREGVKDYLVEHGGFNRQNGADFKVTRAHKARESLLASRSVSPKRKTR